VPNVGWEVVAPLFGVMAAGYLASRFRLLDGGTSQALGQFTFVVANPALIFVSLARMPVGDFFDWPYLGAFVGGMAVMYVFGLVIARAAFPGGLTTLALHALTATYSSTGYIGLPLILMAFGEVGRIHGIIGMVVTIALFVPLTIVLAEIEKARGGGRFTVQPLLQVALSPPLLATVAGLVVSATGLPLPRVVGAICDVLGAAFIPCSLFAAGLFLYGRSIGGDAREIAWLMVAKLVLHPLLTAWLAYRVFELPPLLATIAVLQAALPTGVPVFSIAQQYRTYQVRSSAVIVLSTAVSVATLSALLIALVP